MNDGKIYIIVTNKLPTQSGPSPMPTPTPAPTGKEQTGSESMLAKYFYHRFFNFMEAQTKKAVNYSINNIGNFTGDYQTQRNIQAGLSMANDLMNIGTAAMSGFIATGGNPIGALIGATLAVGASAINFAYEINSLNMQQKKSDYAISQIRARSGLNQLTDGSRGTEN